MVAEVALESEEAFGSGDASTTVKLTAVASGSREVFAEEKLRPNTSSIQNPTLASDPNQLITFLIQSQNVMILQMQADRKEAENQKGGQRAEGKRQKSG